MGKIGKISSLKKEYSRNTGSLEASLAMNGFSRFPNTYVRIVCFKEPNGEYRTGLNPKATYLNKLSPEERKIEVSRIESLRKELEELTGLDLGPRSDYYKGMFDDKMDFRATMVKLVEGDNIYNFEDPYQRITYEWLRVHPIVASSYQAWERGDYPPTTQFFVNDDAIEEEILYKKKTLINTAIANLNALSIEKRKKVARLLDLPITDNTKEMHVYNVLDTFIKQAEIRNGEHKGANPVELFNKFSNMDDKLVHVKDLVNQAIKHSIYRVSKIGRITEGGVEIAKSKEELVEHLMLDKYQEDKITLEEKLNYKKSVAK